MRIIKFRCWDKKNKTMNWHGMIGMKGMYAGQNVIEPVIMQFTGLKDKNGKEIYDGDIVFWNESKAKIYWNESECSFYMEWMSGACLEMRNHIEPFPTNTNVMLYEVVGNIYENPELLK